MCGRYLLGLAVVLIYPVAISAQEKELPQLVVKSVKVGESYKTDGGGANVGAVNRNTWAKVIQVIDDDNVLIGTDNGAEKKGDPRHTVLFWCKVPTKGLTDDKIGFLANFIGTDKVTISGTTRYQTANGATKTVFVLEPVKPARPLVGEMVKTGAAVYEKFPVADRPKLVKDWEGELEALKRAIKDDEERLAKAKTPKDKQHFTRLIAEYKEKLRKHEINDPPYVLKK